MIEGAHYLNVLWFLISFLVTFILSFSFSLVNLFIVSNKKLETLRLVSSLTSQDIFIYNFQLVVPCSSKSALLL